MVFCASSYTRTGRTPDRKPLRDERGRLIGVSNLLRKSMKPARRWRWRRLLWQLLAIDTVVSRSQPAGDVHQAVSAEARTTAKVLCTTAAAEQRLAISRLRQRTRNGRPASSKRSKEATAHTQKRDQGTPKKRREKIRTNYQQWTIRIRLFCFMT